jgi:hypothetical protein
MHVQNPAAENAPAGADAALKKPVKLKAAASMEMESAAAKARVTLELVGRCACAPVRLAAVADGSHDARRGRQANWHPTGSS